MTPCAGSRVTPPLPHRFPFGGAEIPDSFPVGVCLSTDGSFNRPNRGVDGFNGLDPPYGTGWVCCSHGAGNIASATVLEWIFDDSCTSRKVPAESKKCACRHERKMFRLHL